MGGIKAQEGEVFHDGGIEVRFGGIGESCGSEEFSFEGIGD